MTDKDFEQTAFGQRGVFTSIERAAELVTRKRGVDLTAGTSCDRDTNSLWGERRERSHGNPEGFQERKGSTMRWELVAQLSRQECGPTAKADDYGMTTAVEMLLGVCVGVLLFVGLGCLAWAILSFGLDWNPGTASFVITAVVAGLLGAMVGARFPEAMRRIVGTILLFIPWA